MKFTRIARAPRAVLAAGRDGAITLHESGCANVRTRDDAHRFRPAFDRGHAVPSED